MTYRLAPRNPWPVAQEDLGKALVWVRAQIGARGGDPTRIVLTAHSAGAAHVAQYVSHPRFHVAPGGGIAGAVTVSGLYDTVTAEQNHPCRPISARTLPTMPSALRCPDYARRRCRCCSPTPS